MKNKWVNITVIAMSVILLIVVIAAFVVKDNNTTTPNTTSTNYVTAYDKNASFGKSIPTSVEYSYLLNSLKQQILQQNSISSDNPTAVNNFWATQKYQGKKLIDVVTEYAKNNLKEYKVLFLEATKKKLSIDKTSWDNLNSKLTQQFQSYGSNPETAVQQLYGVTAQQYVDITRNLNLAYVILKSETEKGIKVTDSEVKTYFDKDTDKVKENIEKVTVRHILYMTVDQQTGQALSTAEQQKAKKDADAMYKKIKAGGDIAAMAKKYSQDTGSKDQGGLLTFKRGEMVKEFEDWSFKAKIGQVGEVKTQYGYHVIKLEAKLNTYKDLAADAKTALIDKKYQDIVNGWKKSDAGLIDISSIK